MGGNSRIERTDHAFSPWWGCSRTRVMVPAAASLYVPAAMRGGQLPPGSGPRCSVPGATRLAAKRPGDPLSREFQHATPCHGRAVSAGRLHAAHSAARKPGGCPVTRPWTCYLIHFTERYEHAGHYTGSTPDLPARLAKHEAGQGARLMAVIKDAGISWVLARTWPGGRARERQLKQQGGASRHCPVCKGGPGIDWKAGPALIPTTPGPRSPKLSVTPPEEPLWDSVSARLAPAEAQELGRRLADAERGAWAAAGESTGTGWRARMDLACDLSRLRNTEASAVQRVTEAREIAQAEGWAPEPHITEPGPADTAPGNARQQKGPAPMGSFSDERESTNSAGDAGAQEGREVTRAQTGKLDPEQFADWAWGAVEGLHGAAVSDVDRGFAEGFEREALRVSADYEKAGRELAACWREPGSPHPDPGLAARGWHVSECGVYSRARARDAELAEASAAAAAPELEREAG